MIGRSTTSVETELRLTALCGRVSSAMNSFVLGNDHGESSWPERSDETERGHRDDHEQSLKTLQSDHQDRGHDEEHQRHDGRDRPVNTCKFSSEERRQRLFRANRVAFANTRLSIARRRDLR